MQLHTEVKKIGWLCAIMGIFIAIYGAVATAIDSTLRGYEVGEISIYAIEVAWMYNFYLEIFAFGAFVTFCGLILAVPLFIQDKKQNSQT